MSLLMQALKKAEQTKQKQQSDAVLSLSPTETHPEPAFAAEKSAELTNKDVTVSDDARPSLKIDHADPSMTSLNAHELTSASTEREDAFASKHDPFLHASLTPQPDSTFAKRDTPSADDAVFEIPASKPEQSMADRLQRPRINPEQINTSANTNPSLAAEQQKAKSVFSSKSKQSDRRQPWIIGLSAVSLLTLFGFAYVYWQSNQLENRPGLLGNAITTETGPTPTPVAAPASAPSTNQGANTTPVGATETGNAPVTAAASVPATSLPSNNLATSGLSARVVNDDATKTAKNSLKNTAPNAAWENQDLANSPKVSDISSPKRSSHVVNDANAIKIRTGNSGNQINPALDSAYQAFVAGDIATAERQYQSVLLQEPQNRDALLGLAALALNRRDADKAGTFYSKLVELDPNDPDAIAGLTSLQQGDPVQSESRLKKALTLHPNAGAILFALGNLYAQQARWSDAQQNYFRAFTTQPGNADYAFNLAVSLDRLNQSKLAKDYYQRALDAGQSGPGNFSRSKVQQRIADLGKALNE